MKKKVLLVDSNKFKKEASDKIILSSKNYSSYGKQHNSPAISIDMKNYISDIWSNGWCPLMKIVKRNNFYYGIISNSLIPTDIYNNITVEIDLI